MSKRIEKIMSNIECPTAKNGIVDSCIKQFNKEQEKNESVVSSVFDIFDNSSIENILIKVIVLNNRYSAGLTDNKISESKRIEYELEDKSIPVDVLTMAEHIFENKAVFDSVSKNEDIIKLVKVLRSVDDNYQDAYSFATKYCSWTFENNIVPIVDSYVKGLLYRLNNKFGFCEPFTQAKMNDYDEYYKIYESFIKEYNLYNYSYKDIDKYLWQYAKNLLVNDNLDIRI